MLDSLDAVATDPTVPVLPLQVLGVQDVSVGGKLKQRLLVQWEHQPPSMASLEDAADMSRRFPTAWGQAVGKAGGNVTSCIRTLKKGKKARRVKAKSG